MKKNSFTAQYNHVLALLVLVFFALIVSGCPDNGPTEHTDPEFLIGSWSRSDGTNFIINDDLTFECDFRGVGMVAWITGKLDYSDPLLGPNDYFLLDMTTPVEPSDVYVDNGNLRGPVEDYSENGLIGTLRPRGNNQFFFSSPSHPEANIFFGGMYDRQP